jgi:hypothetical protein
MTLEYPLIGVAPNAPVSDLLSRPLRQGGALSLNLRWQPFRNIPLMGDTLCCFGEP